MKLNSSSRSYKVSRAVEEPLEATFELGEDIQKLSEGLCRPVRLGIFGCIILVLLLIPSLYYLSIMLYDIYQGSIEVSTWAYWNIVVFGFAQIFLISIIATTIVYLVQVNKFNTHLIQRYSLITDFKHARPSEAADSIAKRKQKQKNAKKHMKNPIYAMLDLVEESMHALPQIIKLVRFCTYFITIFLFYLFFWIITRTVTDINNEFYSTPLMLAYELIVGAVAFTIFLITLKLLIDSENLFTYLRSRHEIIDSVRFDKNLSIPAGKNQLDRIINYLMEHDPYVKSSSLASDEAFNRNVTLPGRSGRDYKFDAYFSDMNVLKSRSFSFGMPMGGFGVFVKVYKSKITLKNLQVLREAVLDVCEKDDIFPLRVVALQWRVAELSDEVYDYVLENPIDLKNTLTHLQVVAEDVDVYSFIPQISYGRDM